MITMARLVAAATVLLASGAQGQDYPDLKGTWRGTNDAVVRGGGTHHENRTGDTAPRLTNTAFTVTFTGQEGRRFWGEIASATATEPLLGVIGHDRRTLYMADLDGYTVATLTPEGQIDMCYMRSGYDMTLAACVLLTRD